VNVIIFSGTVHNLSYPEFPRPTQSSVPQNALNHIILWFVFVADITRVLIGQL